MTARRSTGFDLGVAARGAGRRRDRAVSQLPFPTTRNLIKLGKQPSVNGGARRLPRQIRRHRDAGHDPEQWRPPAADSPRSRLMTASVFEVGSVG